MTARRRAALRGAVAIAAVITLASLPPAVGTTAGGAYAVRLAVIGLLYVSGAVAWDLLGGLAGQVSFGHASFFGMGAYVTAIMVRADVSLALALPLSAGAAAAFGVLWGWPCLRLRGPFFAIATIGVGEATRLVAISLEPITGGATGLTLPIAGRSALVPYYLALGLAVLSIAVSRAIRRSRLGLGLACVREDVDAAEAIGIRSGWLQLQALVASAAVVGMAGAIYARFLYYVEPGDVFAFNRSIALILMAVIGGVNTVWGPALGAALFLALEQFLAASFPTLHLGIYGLLLVVMMRFEPGGLAALTTRHARS
jgi:branched-chain amino acid transport system permease protein